MQTQKHRKVRDIIHHVTERLHLSVRHVCILVVVQKDAVSPSRRPLPEDSNFNGLFSSISNLPKLNRKNR